MSKIDYREYTFRRRDARCRYWAKVVPAGRQLPMPGNVEGAKSIPGKFERVGDSVSLFPGDVVIEGEARHHLHSRGWDYWVRIMTPDGLFDVDPGNRELKRILADAGQRELMEGSGGVAHAVRTVHAYRHGLIDPVDYEVAA